MVSKLKGTIIATALLAGLSVGAKLDEHRQNEFRKMKDVPTLVEKGTNRLISNSTKQEIKESKKAGEKKEVNKLDGKNTENTSEQIEIGRAPEIKKADAGDLGATILIIFIGWFVINLLISIIRDSIDKEILRTGTESDRQRVIDKRHKRTSDAFEAHIRAQERSYEAGVPFDPTDNILNDYYASTSHHIPTLVCENARTDTSEPPPKPVHDDPKLEELRIKAKEARDSLINRRYQKREYTAQEKLHAIFDSWDNETIARYEDVLKERKKMD